MLGCNFSFSLHRHYCRCWAAQYHHLLPDFKCWRWPACLGNVRNSVSQLCLGEMHVGPCGGVTCWTCHMSHSLSLVIFTWPMHWEASWHELQWMMCTFVSDLYLHVFCCDQDTEFWFITWNSPTPGVSARVIPWLSSQLSALSTIKLTGHQL